MPCRIVTLAYHICRCQNGNLPRRIPSSRWSRGKICTLMLLSEAVIWDAGRATKSGLIPRFCRYKWCGWNLRYTSSHIQNKPPGEHVIVPIPLAQSPLLGRAPSLPACSLFELVIDQWDSVTSSAIGVELVVRMEGYPCCSYRVIEAPIARLTPRNVVNHATRQERHLYRGVRLLAPISHNPWPCNHGSLPRKNSNQTANQTHQTSAGPLWNRAENFVYGLWQEGAQTRSRTSDGHLSCNCWYVLYFPLFLSCISISLQQ